MDHSNSPEKVQLDHTTNLNNRIQSFGSATAAHPTSPLIDEPSSQENDQWHPQRRLQERAIFVHDFWSLRRKCLHSTEKQLQKLERDFESIKDPELETATLKRATELLQSLDTQIKNEFDLLQISDPQYVASRGLSIVHFEVPSGHDKSGNWMMLAHKMGKEARSMYDDVRTKEGLLPKLHQKQLEYFVGDGIDKIDSIHIKRPTTILERQPGVLVENHADPIPRVRPRFILWWKVVFGLSCLAWAGFFGVGVIATNTQFSQIFIKFFFWIAILWTLMPTVLLAWMVKFWGGSAGDMLMSSMASLGIWLVMIQIGQTHVSAQLRAEHNSSSLKYSPGGA